MNCQVCGRPSGRRDGLCHRHRVTPGTAARRRQYADQGYRKRRSAALAALADGDPCVRCGGPMYRGQRLDLDHDDHDRTVITGLAHASCNRRAGAVKANRQRRGIDPSNAQILDPTPNPTTGPRWQSRRWLPANGETTRVCTECGVEFVIAHGGHVRCSDECRRLATQRQKTTTPAIRACLGCDELFADPDLTARYCSTPCRDRAAEQAAERFRVTMRDRYRNSERAGTLARTRAAAQRTETRP